MNVHDIQAALKLSGRDVGEVDGVPGRRTMGAIDEELRDVAAGSENWSDERKLVAFEQLVYARSGIEVGVIDGLVGEQTRYARRAYEARGTDKTAPNPAEEKWRDGSAPESEVKRLAGESRRLFTRRLLWPRQKDTEAFYGAPGTGMTTLSLPFPMRLAWEPQTAVERVECHGKCASALSNIWTRVLKTYGHEQLKRLRLDMYGGCLNVRKMRGGSRWSMHAFGCAWDVDPDRNQLKFNRSQATLDDALYESFWRIVYEQGAISLGRERDYDWMHFQFTRDFS